MSNELPTLDLNSSPPKQGQHSNQFRFVSDVMLRHWFLITVCTIIAGITGGLVGHFRHVEFSTFQAQTTLVVKQNFWQNPVMSGLGGNAFGLITPKSLLDRLILDDVARDVAQAIIQDDMSQGGMSSNLTTSEEIDTKASQILGQIQLIPLNDQGQIQVIAFSSQSGDAAKRLANFTVRVLVKHTQLQRVDEQRQMHDVLRQEIKTTRTSLDDAENRQWQFREKMGFKTHNQVWDDMERKNAELNETVITIEVLKQKLADLNRALAKNDKELPDALGEITESVVRELLVELDALRQEHVNLSVVWTSDYPEIVILNDDIAEKKQAVLRAIDELRGSAGGGSTLWDQRQSLYRQKVDINNEIASLDIRKSTLEKNLSAMVKDMPDLNEKSLEYEQLAHSATQIRNQFNQLLQREFEVKSSLNRGTATVERRRTATMMPTTTSGNMSLKVSVGVGVMAGLLLSFALAMMMEASDTSIKSIEDINHYIDLEVIGTIPEMNFGKARGRRRTANVVSTDEKHIDACIVTQHDPKSPISEAYRSLRTNFQFATLRQQPKTIMVTSSVPGEGKTTTSVNFAVTMADRGLRVLIVDTDLRRPNVHRMLKMERGTGLADVLRDSIPTEDVIRPTQTENLWIISSGRVPPNPSELIGSERMKKSSLN